MADSHPGQPSGLSSPAEDCYLCTPNDSTDLPTVSRFIEVQAAGNISLVTYKGTSITKYFSAGYHWIRVKRILNTNTTAALIYVYF